MHIAPVKYSEALVPDYAWQLGSVVVVRVEMIWRYAGRLNFSSSSSSGQTEQTGEGDCFFCESENGDRIKIETGSSKL